VECLPNEMQRIFHRGGAYSSGVSRKDKEIKFSVNRRAAMVRKSIQKDEILLNKVQQISALIKA